jgi:type 1 glutamine amidotransferase
VVGGFRIAVGLRGALGSVLMKFPNLFALFSVAAAPLLSAQITYPGGEGPGAGKHVVFIASDHEYRSEEACPALARILAKSHGFTCTVIFGVDRNGEIQAGSSDLPGMEALKDADLLVIFARFLNPPAEQMAHLSDYLARGGPVVGLRTSSHAFKIPADAPTARYSFDSKVAGYEKGFGHQVLGNTWVGHHGDNHRQGTRILLEPGRKEHPILRGVADRAFCHAGGYVGVAAPDFTVLATSQPLMSMDPQSEPDPNKAAMPCAWTREYEGAAGRKGRVFHSTQGASEDFLDPAYRRLVLNGIFWAAGLEERIRPDLAIDFIGPYRPGAFKFEGEVKGVKPGELAGFESPIMPAKPR